MRTYGVLWYVPFVWTYGYILMKSDVYKWLVFADFITSRTLLTCGLLFTTSYRTSHMFSSSSLVFRFHSTGNNGTQDLWIYHFNLHTIRLDYIKWAQSSLRTCDYQYTYWRAQEWRVHCYKTTFRTDPRPGTFASYKRCHFTYSFRNAPPPTPPRLKRMASRFSKAVLLRDTW